MGEPKKTAIAHGRSSASELKLNKEVVDLDLDLDAGLLY